MFVKVLPEKTTGRQLMNLCTSSKKPTYQNTYCDNVIASIGKALELDLSKKFYSAKDLKTLRGKTAKKV